MIVMGPLETYIHELLFLIWSWQLKLTRRDMVLHICGLLKMTV